MTRLVAPRPVPSRATRLERQARVVAAKAVRGARDLGAGLAPTPAARAHVPGSAGAPIPQVLRGALEQAFGADLSVVRVHRDAAAAVAARARCARAFTAGRDIYLAAEASDLHSARGRELLAHEVAHVLQQTGRRDAGGHLRATVLEGEADVQCEDLAQVADDAGWFAALPTWDQVVEAHGGKRRLGTHVVALQAIIGGVPPASGAEQALADLAVDPMVRALDAPLRGFYVDAMKWAGAHRAARALLLHDKTLPTTFRSRPFYEYIRAQGLGWITGLASTHEFLKAYYPGMFVWAYRAVFFGPGRWVPDLEQHGDRAAGAAKTFEAKLVDRLNALVDAPGSSENELAMIAQFAMLRLDAGRRRDHVSLLKQLADRNPTWTPLWVHRALASQYAELAEDDPWVFPSDTPEAMALYGAVAASIKDVAGRAVAYWDMIGDATTAAITGKDTGAFYAEPAKAKVEQIGADPAFAELGPTLARAGAKVLAKKDAKLPGPAVFAANVEAARTTLRVHSFTYSARLIRLARDVQPTSDEAVAIGVVLRQLSWLDQALAGHVATAKQTGDTKARGDARVATQIRFARELLRVGRQLKINVAIKRADEFLGQGAHLALLSDWHPVADFGLAALRAHLAHHGDDEHLFTEITGLTYGGYRDFLSSREFEAITSAAAAVRPVSGTPSLGGALAAATEATRPRQFAVDHHEWTDPTESSRAAVMLETGVGDALVANPLTQDLLARERKADELVVVTTTYRHDRPLTVTLVPGMDQLMAVVHATIGPELEAWWRTTFPKTALPSPTDWNNYRIALAAYYGSLADADRGPYAQKLRGAITADLAAKQRPAYEAGRKLASHDRGVVAAMLPPLWQRFKRREPGTYDAAARAFRLIEDYGRSVWPEQDRLLQVTTLVLETATAMQGSFGGAPEWIVGAAGDLEVIGRAWGLLEGALATWDSTEPTWAGRRPREDIVELSGLATPAVEANAAATRTLHKAVAGRALAVHRSKGVVANRGTGKINAVGWSGYPVVKGEAFQWGDVDLLVEVHQTFTYHPPMVGFSGLQLPWAGTIPGDHLILDAGGAELTSPGVPLLTVMRLAPGGSAETVVLTSSDHAALSAFSFRLGEWSGLSHILAAGALIEAVFNALLEVAEFIPGVGQGIAIGRFILGVLDTLTNPQFLQILDLIANDGLGVIATMFEEMLKHLDPEALLAGLLFEADFTTKLRDNPKIKNDTAANKFVPMAGRSKTSLWDRVGKVLLNIARLGIRILDALKRLTKRVQVPVRAAQLWVLSHPAAGLFLDLAGRGLELIASMGIDQLAAMLENPEKDWKDVLATSLNEAGQQILDQGRDMVDALRHLELPSEVVPVELIVDFFVELVVTKVGSRKVKAVMQGGKAALEAVGLWGRVNGFISEKIRQNGLDPNQFYRDTVVAFLQPKLERVRDGFVADLLGALAGIPVLGKLTEPPGTPIRLAGAFGAGDFPETAPFATTPPSVRHDLALPSPTGGAALAPAVRRPLEQAWGHDLSHVRLHTDADAAPVTTAFGADGLTTGSHVYLRPGLSDSGDHGRRVLRHELAHVVQQTGPRPMGGAHSSTPSPGVAGRGLQWDGAREAEAERASQAGAVPRSFGGGGLQPMFGVKFMKDFFARLGSGKTLVRSKHEVLDEASSLQRTLTPETEQLGTTVMAAIKAAIAVLPASTYVKPFDNIQPQLLASTDAAWPTVLQGLPTLLARSRLKVQPRPGADRQRTPEQGYIDPSLFQLEVRRFLFAVTGVAWVVELNAKTATILEHKVSVVDGSDPVKALGAGYFHLPLLEASPAVEQLWDLLVENSFAKTKGYARTDPTKHLTFKIATKLVLGRSGPQPGIYERDAFKLKSGRITVIANQVGRIEEIAGKGKWPTPTEYANPDAASVADADLRDLGLRVGPYRDWDPDKHPVVDRDPHHITQFLVVEYFRNLKGAAKEPFPFKESRNTYPGVSGSGTEVDSISGPPGTIDIATLYPGRGGAMPTLLLARPTHQSGLHFVASKAKAGMAASQAATVHDRYTRALRAADPAVADAMAMKASVKALGKEKDDNAMPAGLQVTRRQVMTATVTAVRATYAALRDEMTPILKEALAVHETRYYDLMSTRMSSSSKLTWSVIEPAYKKAIGENQTIVENQAGFQ